VSGLIINSQLLKKPVILAFGFSLISCDLIQSGIMEPWALLCFIKYVCELLIAKCHSIPSNAQLRPRSLFTLLNESVALGSRDHGVRNNVSRELESEDNCELEYH
jgi:hypothetical protein